MAWQERWLGTQMTLSWAVANHLFKGQGSGGNKVEEWRPGGVRTPESFAVLSKGPEAGGAGLCVRGQDGLFRTSVSLYSWLRRTEAPSIP